MVPYADAIKGVLDNWDVTKYMEIGEMPLHAGTIKDILNSWDVTKYMEIGGMALNAGAIKALLSNWGATMYDGSQDVRPWLMEIEEKYRIHGIPEIHMTDMAVKFTNGEVNTVLTAMYKARVAEAGAWSWEDFKESLIKIEDDYRENMKYARQSAEDFRSEHPYAAAALSVTLIGTGAVLVLPTVGAAILGAVGFGSGGVTAGSIAASLQSAIYGGATGGVFSVLQSLGATTVASPFAAFAGSGLGAAGAWCQAGSRDGEEPAPAEEPAAAER